MKHDRSGHVAILLTVFVFCCLAVVFFKCQQLQKANLLLSYDNEKLLEDNLRLISENKSLKREMEDLKRENAELKRRLKNSSVSLHEDGTKTAYLTFDDGPSINTPAVLDILKECGIKATFFVIGNNTEFGKSMYRRIVQEGHAIGNHTYSHNYSVIYSSKDAFWRDVEKLNDLIYEATGVRPKILRFPGGSNNHVSWKYSGKDFMKELVEEADLYGYQYFDWNVSSTDAVEKTRSKQEIINAVLEGVKDKKEAVILFHDSATKTTTVEALPVIIEELKKQGFVFKTLSEAQKPIHFLQ